MATPIGTLPAAAEWFGPSDHRPTDDSARARARRVAEFFAGARRGRASADSDTRGDAA